jgi:hypothetical protein
MPDKVANILKHCVLTACTLGVLGTLLMAALGKGNALQLWQTCGLPIIGWNALMIAPNAAVNVIERMFSKGVPGVAKD